MPMVTTQRFYVYYLFFICHLYFEITINFSAAVIITFFLESYFIHSEVKTFNIRQGVLLQ